MNGKLVIFSNRIGAVRYKMNGEKSIEAFFKPKDLIVAYSI